MGRLSRAVYKPMEFEEGVYLHVYNHCVENRLGDFPFGEVEKEKFLKHLQKTLHLYSIECLSAVVMDNHFHLILFIPKETFSVEEMARRIATLQRHIPVEKSDWYLQRRYEMSNDISYFMKELQQGFTTWYNRTRDFSRRGTLWENRFKCTKLADLTALVTCLLYVELNPVRAKIVQDPADYRFCTYGVWQQRGKHPYAASLERHLAHALSYCLKSIDLNGLELYFRSKFAGIVASEQGANIEQIDLAMDEASLRQRNVLLQRSRYWIDSVVLGAKTLVKEHAAQFWGKERGLKRQTGRVFKDGDTQIHSLRKLSKNI